MKEQKTVEETYENFWKDIVENPDGTLNKEQVKKELSDYGWMLDNIPRLYCELTNNRISKPMTHTHHILEIVEQRIEDSYNEGYKDACSPIKLDAEEKQNILEYIKQNMAEVENIGYIINEESLLIDIRNTKKYAFWNFKKQCKKLWETIVKKKTIKLDDNKIEVVPAKVDMSYDKIYDIDMVIAGGKEIKGKFKIAFTEKGVKLWNENLSYLVEGCEEQIRKIIAEV